MIVGTIDDLWRFPVNLFKSEILIPTLNKHKQRQPQAAFKQVPFTYLKPNNMKHVVLFLFLQFFFTGAFRQTTLHNRQLKVINVSGNGYERGYQQGQQLKKEIAESIVLWKSDLLSNAHMPADSFIHQFLTHTNFTPAIKKYTPDILEEVRGIANGAEQPFDDILAFQLVDEYWVY